MKVMRLLVLMLLAGCSNAGSPKLDAAVNNSMAGSYISQGAPYETKLSLGADGRGGMLSRNNDGTFKQLMTFRWKVDGTDFYMSDIYFSTDGKRILKATSDDRFAYEFAEPEIHTRDKSGGWNIWRRTSGEPDRAVIDAIIHD